MYFPNLVCRIICTWINAQEFSGIISFMFLIFLTIIRMLATYEFSVKVLRVTFLLLLLMNIGLVTQISLQSIFTIYLLFITLNIQTLKRIMIFFCVIQNALGFAILRCHTYFFGKFETFGCVLTILKQIWDTIILLILI